MPYIRNSFVSNTENNYTDAEKTKLAGIEAGAEVNVLEGIQDSSGNDLTITNKKAQLSKSAVGLPNVDNTSDADKPISTATQTALDGKVPTTRTVNSKALSADITLDKTDIGLGNVDNTSDLNKPISTATQIALDNKANVDGVYENMSVGNADQLNSTLYTEDKEPYGFRTSGGSADIGNRSVDKIVGGTIMWNQTVRTNYSFGTNGVSVSITNGLFNLNGTATSTGAITTNLINDGDVPVNHIFALRVLPVSNYITPSSNSWYFWNNGNGAAYYSPLIRQATAADARFTIRAKQGTVFNNMKMRIQLIDLTRMFGASVANKFVGKLDLFNKLFPRFVYTRTTGEANNTRPTKRITVGFNAFDLSTGKAKIVGGIQYQITGNYSSVSFVNSEGDTENISIVNTYFSTYGNGVLTVTGADNTTCVHLVWSGYRDGEYEEYKEKVYDLDSNGVLRGIPKFDNTYGFYFDGDTYESDGTVTRRYGSINLNTLTWTSVDDHKEATIDNIKPDTTNFIANTNIGLSISGTTIIADTTGNPSGGFVYELATPTIEQAAPFQIPQIVDDFGTEEYIQYSSAVIPQGHITKYAPNLRDKIQNLPNIPEITGDYIVHYDSTNRTCTFIAKTSDLPTLPTADGNYLLKCTVADGEATLNWEAEV